jgi:hypothetical protein
MLSQRNRGLPGWVSSCIPTAIWVSDQWGDLAGPGIRGGEVHSQWGISVRTH